MRNQCILISENSVFLKNKVSPTVAAALIFCATLLLPGSSQIPGRRV